MYATEYAHRAYTEYVCGMRRPFSRFSALSFDTTLLARGRQI